MTTITMPRPGQSVTEGTIVRWLKAVGDPVTADETLVEIETEKVNIELPSPVTGTLSRILAQEGDTIPVGADLAVIDDGVESAPSQPQDSGATPAGTAADSASDTSDQRTVVAAPPSTSLDGTSSKKPRPSVPAAAASPTATVQTAPSTNGHDQSHTARYSPAVLRLAAEHNLDLTRITGTGLGGRVTRKDVVAFIENPPAEPAAPPAQPAAALSDAQEPPVAADALVDADQATQPAAPTPPPSQPVTTSPVATQTTPPTDDEEVIRPTPTRLTIARNMLRVAQTVPVAWLVVECDVTSLVRRRAQERDAFRQREGIDLTYLPYVIEAVAAALREHPMLNSEWRDDTIVLKHRINIGIAVGAEDGLVVPVIPNADRLNTTGLAHAVNDLATRARTRKLRLDDITGNTFTVNNTGVFGSIISQPILPPNTAAILTTEAIQKRPVIHDDAIAVRSLMNCCLSFDHRIIDGTQAGAFLQSVKRRLEAL